MERAEEYIRLFLPRLQTEGGTDHVSDQIKKKLLAAFMEMIGVQRSV
jgi:hypothetical protein